MLMKTKIILIMILTVCVVILPVFGQQKDQRIAPISVDLIIEGSEALSGVLNDVSKHLSDSLVEGILQNGDHLTIWSAGKTAQILFEDTLKTQEDKEKINNILKTLPAEGDSADFSGALQKSASQKSGENIRYIMLVSASHTTLSPAILGASGQLIKYSRVEDYAGWLTLIIAPDINDKVRQAASAYFSGIQ